MGACHSLELPFVFGQVQGPFGQVFVGDRANAQRLSERMMDAWLAFARGADPSSEGLGPWPAYAAQGRATMQLSRTPGIELAPDEARRTVWDELV
jgi:para-nitrobenzyl esterase